MKILAPATLPQAHPATRLSDRRPLRRSGSGNRVRLDNRFIQNRATGQTPYTHRLRYLIGLDFPISAQRTNLYFTAYEEAFFNTYSSASSVYGENWAYAALGIKLNDHHKIESGPLYITWNTGGKAWLHQFYLQLTWLSRL